MTDILETKIHNTFETYTQNIRPFLSGFLNHVHGIEHLDKTTLTDLLEQATDHTEVFQQNFVNGYNFFKRYSQDNRLITLFNGYELFLNVVRSAFAFADELESDKVDYPVPRTLRESEEKLASCYDRLQQFLGMTQPSTIGPMAIQTETEVQATQDNTLPTPSDTTRHPMAYPDTELDFEHDPELDTEDQNILAIETTDTLDNYIDNIDPTFDNRTWNSSINDCTDTKQTVDNNDKIDNSDIGDLTESNTETIDDNLQDQTDNIDNEDQDNSEFESTKIIQTDNNTLDINSPIDFNDHNSSMKPKLKLTIVTKSLNQLKVKMKVTLETLNLKALILTLMLAQSMTLKILKPWDPNINKKLELWIWAKTCTHKPQNVQTYIQ